MIVMNCLGDFKAMHMRSKIWSLAIWNQFSIIISLQVSDEEKIFFFLSFFFCLKLFHLPAKKSVDMVLEDYANYKKSKGNSDNK